MTRLHVTQILYLEHLLFSSISTSSAYFKYFLKSTKKKTITSSQRALTHYSIYLRKCYKVTRTLESIILLIALIFIGKE